jgi:hypothetical protein
MLIGDFPPPDGRPAFLPRRVQTTKRPNMRMLLATLVVASSWLPSCEDVATDQQIAEMCRTKLKVEDKVDTSPISTRIAIIKRDTGVAFQKLEAEKKQLIEGLDAKRVEKLKKTRKAAARKKVNEFYAALKKDKEQEIQSRVDAATMEMESAIKKTKEKAEDDQFVATTFFNMCVNDARIDGVTKRAAICRTKATALSQYFECP